MTSMLRVVIICGPALCKGARLLVDLARRLWVHHPKVFREPSSFREPFRSIGARKANCSKKSFGNIFQIFVIAAVCSRSGCASPR
ncbi:hypothetical protein IHQ68_00750 [Chelatococcus sambhunathii]|uniref:Secreted protein n=1 Tax=Chelatococcus sambhunathii TaxID=363953 RepID=A0ABU1DAM2_9HYPH|nr:hypothetical protein [Chelatococcus sambhunathii]MDR4305157.1 hypothetical protein [Chelatococcus sambhunathii]